MRDLTRRFKALSEETRLRILALMLRHGELCVCEVERFLGVSQSKASRHLRYLLNAGIVRDRRDGLWVYYDLAQPRDEGGRILLEALKRLLAEVPLPDVSAALESMREERGKVAEEAVRHG